MQDDYTQTLRIHQEYLKEYRRHLTHIMSRLKAMETESYRTEFAKTEPEIARLFERKTLEEKQEGAREPAMSLAVAWAVVYGIQLALGMRE